MITTFIGFFVGWCIGEIIYRCFLKEPLDNWLKDRTWFIEKPKSPARELKPKQDFEPPSNYQTGGWISK